MSIEQGRPDGGLLAQKLTNIVHEEDRTRPTTAGFNNDVGAIQNELASAVDIPAFNYKPTKYAQILKDHPNWMIFASETSSGVSSRGVYHLDREISETPLAATHSYDVTAPPWAYVADVEFDAQEKNPNVLGEFVWTGFDYLGKPTPYFNGRGAGNDADWRSRSSYFGSVDLAGFPKDRFYLYQSHWTTTPMVHLLRTGTGPGWKASRFR